MLTMSTVGSNDSTGMFTVPKNASLVPDRIFVGGIPSGASVEELMVHFSKYGKVKDGRIVSDRAGVSKGYGFITFESQEDVNKLLMECQSVTFCHKKLCIGAAYHKARMQELDFVPCADKPGSYFYPPIQMIPYGSTLPYHTESPYSSSMPAHSFYPVMYPHLNQSMYVPTVAYNSSATNNTTPASVYPVQQTALANNTAAVNTGATLYSNPYANTHNTDHTTMETTNTEVINSMGTHYYDRSMYSSYVVPQQPAAAPLNQLAAGSMMSPNNQQMILSNPATTVPSAMSPIDTTRGSYQLARYAVPSPSPAGAISYIPAYQSRKQDSTVYVNRPSSRARVTTDVIDASGDIRPLSPARL